MTRGIVLGAVLVLSAKAGVVYGQAVSCLTVTRGQKTTCTATGGTHYKNWQFAGRGNTISRGATVDSPTWTGVAVDNGGVAVDITTAAGTKTVYGALSVQPRNAAPFALKTVSAVQQLPGYTCVSLGGSVTLGLPSPPSNSGNGDNVLGKYCNIDDFTFAFGTVVDGGPNNGYRFMASVTSQTKFFWVFSADLANTASAFYKAQCGTYNAQTNKTGYITGLQLSANTVHHESGSTTSHYAEWVAALANSGLNPGGNLEQLALAGTDAEYQQFVSTETSPNIATINSTVLQEPCSNGLGVSDDASCVFDGYVNYANGGQYATCN